MMQRVAETDPLSYYQIAGIHGLPYIRWGEAPRDDQGPDYGYCTHGSTLFATWHRPYLALVEQRITAHAVNEAGKIRGKDPTSVRSSLRSLGACPANRRCRYWDWAEDDSAIPNVLIRPTVTVTRPEPTADSPSRPTSPTYSTSTASPMPA